LAIENNDIEAIYNLANLYDLKKNYEEAIKYYKMAINKKDINSIYNLGKIILQ
jgi:TPR repeat protein